MTDGQLLERFATGGEAAELAFAALVERHGPLVLHTCRSILCDEHAAEDAFQATFLVLVRKAGSLWVRDSLGPWLHQVAYRAARCARSAAARRTAHERRAAEMIAERDDSGRAGDGEGDGAGEDFGAVMHEEIERLPERYRVPVVLCDLEGRTHEQAARHLGCPVGTVKSRLARGRGRLRDRLIRRGLRVPARVLATGLLPQTTRVAPSASWADATTRAAMQIAAGQPLTGTVAAGILTVMQGVSRGLFMNSLKAVALAVVTLGALAAGAGGLAWLGLRGSTGNLVDPSETRASRPAAGEEGPQPGGPRPEARDAAEIRGQWEVLYLAGTVAGKREGYAMPYLIVPITDKTINLPALTGKPNDPMNYVGGMPYTLDPGRKSGAIDMQAGPVGGKALRGIYRLKGDILTICYDESDRGRPETFAANKPSECLIILRRQDVPAELEALPRSRGPGVGRSR
jgi:RNA polymerase sigma factor (sigma-70 family)